MAIKTKKVGKRYKATAISDEYKVVLETGHGETKADALKSLSKKLKKPSKLNKARVTAQIFPKILKKNLKKNKKLQKYWK